MSEDQIAPEGSSAASEAIIEASESLFDAEPAFRRLLPIHGYPTFTRYDDPSRSEQSGASAEESDPFYVLVNAIANQQLSSKAAGTILGRLRTACGGVITKEAILELGAEGVRPMGFSGQKTLSLVALAEAAQSGELALADIDHMEDEEVISMISAQRGLGRWSAEMFLMFHLGRLNVWPVDDLGVRKGHAKILGLEVPLKPKALKVDGERFHPYRSLAAWYCWAAID